jgi:hypothetical protein
MLNRITGLFFLRLKFLPRLHRLTPTQRLILIDLLTPEISSYVYKQACGPLWGEDVSGDTLHL